MQTQRVMFDASLRKLSRGDAAAATWPCFLVHLSCQLEFLVILISDSCFSKELAEHHIVEMSRSANPMHDISRSPTRQSFLV